MTLDPDPSPPSCSSCTRTSPFSELSRFMLAPLSRNTNTSSTQCTPPRWFNSVPPFSVAATFNTNFFVSFSSTLLFFFTSKVQLIPHTYTIKLHSHSVFFLSSPNPNSIIITPRIIGPMHLHVALFPPPSYFLFHFLCIAYYHPHFLFCPCPFHLGPKRTATAAAAATVDAPRPLQRKPTPFPVAPSARPSLTQSLLDSPTQTLT
jgi:hypothetical protein